MGFPANIPAIAQATAIGASAIAQIAQLRQAAGQAHAGLTFVPAEGPYNLARGERVLTERQNADFTRFLQGVRAGNGAMGIDVTYIGQPGSAPPQFEDGGVINGRRQMVIREMINAAVTDQMATGAGDMVGAIGRRFGLRSKP